MSAAPASVLEYPVAAPPPPGEAQAIAAGVLWLRMPLPFALDHINLWLLPERDGGCTLVDCGYGDTPTRALWERHVATTLRTMPIRRIVATHYHPDHIGNSAWLSQRFGAPVAMTNAEYLTAHAVAEEFASHTPQATIDLFRRHGMAEADRAALARRGNAYRRGVPELPHSIDTMQAGDVWPAGDTTWRIIGGHGHSPDHAALYCAERGVLISGDMLLPKISTNVSVHAFDPDGDPLRRFLDSIAAFLDLPEDTLVLPSHGLPFRGISLRVGQLRAHHDARLRELEDAVRAAAAPQSATDLVPVLFRRELDLQQRYFAMGEAIAHLNHLWRAARLRRLVDVVGTIRFAPPVG
jgi:glyoxylase-like metal-dependent hydrolase (beta-lactamase superfamily II)